MKVIGCTEAGMFANICDYLRHAYLCDQKGQEFGPIWGQNSLYWDQNKPVCVFGQYFEYPFGLESFTRCHEPEWVKGYTEIPVHGHEFRVALNAMIQKYLKLNPVMLELKRRAMEKFDTNSTLGVHVRYTDKKVGHLYGEPYTAIPMTIDTYLNHTEKALAKFGLKSIFLATDENSVVSAFSERFGEKVMALSVPRSNTDEPVHSGHKNIPGFLKGAGVILDAYLLSECKYLIRSTSNVSSFAQFLNLDLEHLNVNEIWLNDKREEDYGLVSSNYEDLF